MQPIAWTLAARETAPGGASVQEQPRAQRLAETVQGRVAIVTGGATGLGRATCLEFAQQGTAVAFNYLDLPDRDVAAQALLTETAIRAHGVPVYCARCDVRNHDEVEQFVAEARKRLGGVHCLVNNAGVTHDGALWRLSVEAWKDVIDTNVTGSFNCIQVVAQHMRAQRYGKIVNVASHQAFQPGFGVSNYAASKAALIGLTKSAAVDLGSSNINVNAVAPGFVKTELARQAAPRDPGAGGARVGAGTRGGTGRCRAGDHVPLQRRGAAHHRSGDRGGRWAHPRLKKPRPGTIFLQETNPLRNKHLVRLAWISACITAGCGHKPAAETECHPSRRRRPCRRPASPVSRW